MSAPVSSRARAAVIVEVLGWADASVGWSRIAAHMGLPAAEVGTIVVTRALGELAEYGAQHHLDLVLERAGRCLVVFCRRPAGPRGLCELHYRRVRTGVPLLGPHDGTVRQCTVCGATWCDLNARSRSRETCGDSKCVQASPQSGRTTRAPDPAIQARNQRIVSRRRNGATLKQLADEFGISVPLISNIAAAAGVYRYESPRGDAQTRARLARAATNEHQ